jgi:hypothetical protein
VEVHGDVLHLGHEVVIRIGHRCHRGDGGSGLLYKKYMSEEVAELGE